MPSVSAPSLHPALLPVGTQVGPWRIVGWAGQGVHGAVYRAVRIGQEHLSPVALKLALVPEDPRFKRERELLSRAILPHTPRLVDQGDWLSPTGSRHPFFTMEWIDGVPLYEWARMFRPSASQQLRLLSQLAYTLQGLHLQGALHRDLKGGNVLVRRGDSRLFLMDFGSGCYPDATTLTPQQLPPGTPAYRAPEAWLFTLQFRDASAQYKARPADDVFALGVTACVLATGEYPEMGEPRRDAQGVWQMDALVLPRKLFSEQVPPLQRELILRMLSIRPELRGTCAELTPALEAAADTLSRLPSPPSAPPEVLGLEPVVARRARMALTVVAGALIMGAGWMSRVAFVQAREAALGASDSVPALGPPGAAEEEAVGLAEEALSLPQPLEPLPASETAVADSPPELSEGQAQPDKKGRCPHPKQVVLNGGCWARLKVGHEECDSVGGSMYQQVCYVPALPAKPGRPSTSNAKPPRPE